MSKTTTWSLVIGVIILSIIDIGLNSVSLIPVIGDILETTSETVIEGIQILLVVIIASIASVNKK